MTAMVVEPQSLEGLSADQLREMAARLITQLRHQGALLEKLTHENALLKRMKFAAQSERFNPEQKSLFEDEIEADLAAVATEIDALQQEPAAANLQEKKQPKRLALPAHLPRRDIHHEPESTTCRTPGCGCQLKRIGEDVAEKLDYVPGVFSVERHIRGKWACSQCETITQAPVDAHVIDKGIPTAGLLAQVLVGKYADHLPLYRQEAIFGRAGLAIPRSTLAQWVGTCGVRLQPLVDALKAEILQRCVLHADETPVAMLKPGEGKTHRAYLWAYAPGAFENMKAVVYDFCESRAGEHARAFLGEWRGSLTCDDFSGYKALIASGVTEVGCLAHARRKFFDLHAANKSQIAEFALQQFARVYDIEREVRELDATLRRDIRRRQTQPVLDALHEWMQLQRQKVPDGSATAKALDYSLRRWEALTRFVDDGQLPVDNNWMENQIRPIAIGRNNWLFAGSLRAGQRAAAVMSLIQSARMNGHDPYAYLRDVLTRLPTHRASRIEELLPHCWQPAT
ncbi:TPA: IS66 family transposase [Pseudomonas aeruginosa]|nr:MULTISPECIES: IS66 family transposase [Burkholderiales]EKU5052131.1 IS66 family transposase [Pseudomonas aeruginosa]MBS0496000.1 IS66 family transposase [Pseudomonadota bacterium]MCS9017915.1 IS66 family transposase [Pseudomonas aeruginosa]HBO4234940.1 IS66 family transposase [Pseudomonas aeruginosa]